MEDGLRFPHNEIGTDPGAIRAFAHGAEGLGATYLLIYDHVRTTGSRPEGVPTA